MGEQAAARRIEATKAFARYFVLGFFVVGALTFFVVYAVLDARASRQETRAIRIAYCTELENLKKQNREDVAEEKKNYPRNLRLLGIKDTPALRKVVEESWAKKLVRNAAKSCPYTADTETTR